ncbi:MAG: NAD(P)-binding domain-containing protein [Anaerolineae bacterium]|nr:NAD(P)-binding domain-containing protein [Anaerolineae bacterium]NUQ04862.1 NAD(P)-binding domain-containing protein [Anaerolineae bacterium]
MKIGIIGTGRIGTGLAKRWTEAGHSVLLGSRDAGKATGIAAAVGAQGGTYQQAVDFGEVVVLTTPWEAAEETLHSLTGLAGKTLIETTNKLRDPRPETSTELIARWSNGAKVVKAFNTVFAQIIHTPPAERLARADIPMVGDHADAKALAAGLIRDAGFNPLDAGGMANARHVENLAAFIIALGYGEGLGTGLSYQFVRVTP